MLGDILTFYQELYANEAYLRTAHWRTSIAELVRLLGYRLAPGLGGSGTFAFEVRPRRAGDRARGLLAARSSSKAPTRRRRSRRRPSSSPIRS